MSKVVVFKIDNGNFEQGFSGTVQIREEGGSVYREEDVILPPSREIPRLYQTFKENYRNLEKVRRIINLETRGFDVDPNQNTNFSTPDDCKEAALEFENSVEDWFNQPLIQQLRGYVENEVGRDESARVIIQTNNEMLKKIPWHLWRLFRNRRQAWISLGAKYSPPSKPFNTPVKILAILGGDQGIDLAQDARVLTNLIDARVELLRQPTRQQLSNKLRVEPWDILCFAGHSKTSESGNDGIIQISNIDSPSLRDLRNAFADAIDNGLKLAIFNSCDGLGLAHRLTELGIPRTIVMREPVPDEVAQEFLQEFLHLFSQGENFHLAVRKAQLKLEGMEAEYPCASWLPVIYQNPAEKSLYWRQSFFGIIKRGIRRLWRSRRVAVTFISLVLVGAALAILISIITSKSQVQPKAVTPPSTPNTPVTTPASIKSDNLDKLFSRGEKILLQNQSNLNKQKGINAFKQGNWDLAIQAFRDSLNPVNSGRNDPESLIYLNNAIVAANAAAKKGQNNIIQIAVSVPITNKQSTAQEILRGVAHAQSKVNCGSVGNFVQAIKNKQTPNCAGTINNRQLQIEIVDDRNGNNNTAEQVALQLVNDDNQKDIIAVIGHYRSEVTKAAVNFGYKDKILVISPTSTSTQLSSIRPYSVLRTVTSDSIAVATLNQHILKKIPSTPIKAVVAYDAGESYSESIKDKFRKVTNQQDIPQYDLKTFNAKQIISEAQQNNANVLLLAPSGTENVLNQALEVVKELSKNPNNNLILLGTSTLYDSSITQNKDFGFASEKTNLVISVPWHRSKSIFEREALQIWGTEKINWVTVMSYDAVQVITKGLSTITGQPTRQLLKDNILNNLDDFTAEGATAPIQFDTQQEKGSRRPIRDNGLGVLVKVQCQNSSCNFIEEKM